VLRTASRNGQVLVVNDVVHDPRTATSVSAYALGERHAFIAVPLLRAGQWVSSLVVAMNRPRQWERREVALLETIAERVWLAIERLRLEVAQREYAMRLQQLNSASLAINTAITTEAVLRETTEQARALIDAHQAVTSLTIGQQWAQTITAISLSDKYAAWRSYNVPPDNSGIYSLVCRTNKPMRLTQAELEAHWAWRGFGGEAASHPPMRGWLAVPLIGRDGSNIGIIQLSDKRDGEFTAADEALLVQLAQMASVALENQQLYDQEQMARAQAEEASRLKDDFLATVSHELRTPLTSILGYAHLLHTRKRDEAYVTQTTEKILRSAQSQAQLIEDILDVSRIVSGKLRLSPQKIDLRLVIADAIDTVSPAIQAKGLQLQTVLPPEAAIVLGDPHRLQQVIWNLLSNAVKFTPNGGAVRLVLEQCDDLTDLTVSDTGRGIDPEFLPYVFDRFRQAEGSSTRAFGGLGLGLSIVRHLVELHGGSVRAHSAGVGAGAAFTVRLPTAVHDPAVVAQIQVADAAPTDATVPSELEGLRVLVVDDQPEIVELLRDLFTTCGAIVETSTDARNGLEQLRSWRPDVLISDIAMPGNDGYWLIEQIRLLAPDEGGVTPAIALTAYVRGEERTRVLTSGFQRYVPKPIEPAELRDVVASLVREHPRAGH
jgi:signal transduction histidine kinase/CheY-like chemotaxis protein